MNTKFEIVHLKRCPMQYNNLSGLLHIFKSKLGQPAMPSDRCKVSTRFTYVLNNWGEIGSWPQTVPDPDSIAGNFKSLPSGCFQDPIAELQLAAIWPSCTGDMIVDNNVHSGFQATEAPVWSVRLQYLDDVLCLLSYNLQEFMKVTARSESMADLLNFSANENDNSSERDIGLALDRIAAPSTSGVIVPIPSKLVSGIAGISKVVSDSRTFLKRGAATLNRIATVGDRIPFELMRAIKEYIFATDSDEEDQQHPVDCLSQPLKAAPLGSFTHRISAACIVLNLCHGGIYAVAQLWHCVVTELRRHLDVGDCIPNLDSFGPDFKYCLLHQKLQMLNCCINRKREREASPVGEEDFNEEDPIDLTEADDLILSSDDVAMDTTNDNEMSTADAADFNESTFVEDLIVDRGDEDTSQNDNNAGAASRDDELDSHEPAIQQDNTEPIAAAAESVENEAAQEPVDMSVDDDVVEVEASNDANPQPDDDSEAEAGSLDSDSDEFFDCDDDDEVDNGGSVTPPPPKTETEAQSTAEGGNDEKTNQGGNVEETNQNGSNEDSNLVVESAEVEERLKSTAITEETTAEEPLPSVDSDAEKVKPEVEADDEEEKSFSEEGGKPLEPDVSMCSFVSLPSQPPLHAAEGRLKEFGDVKLRTVDALLYVPVTQQHALLTEDQLEEQAEVFEKLGNTKEGSKIRAKMQSISLRSDMEAFKAANPGCVLEDFVTWYSPRDIETGALSPRMMLPGNLWVTTWEAARPVPAHRQKRLFDDTKEAEKVLQFLTNLKPAEVVHLLLPVSVKEALLTLRSSSESIADLLPSVPHLCSQMELRASQLFRYWGALGSNDSTAPDPQILELIRQLSFAERLVERARSLQHKFSAIGDADLEKEFVRSLLEHPEVKLEGAANGKIGHLIQKYFLTQQELLISQSRPNNEGEPAADGPGGLDIKEIPPLPEPAGREFIIRTMARHPSAYSRRLPHRLYAVLMRSEFRLASAVSSDTTFF